MILGTLVLFIALIVIVSFCWIYYNNLVWDWHKKHDGSDGRWPWYICRMYRDELKKCTPRERLEFMRKLYVFARDRD